MDMTTKAQATKAKLDKWEYIKLASFYTEKEIINKVKRQSAAWEKVLVNHISHKGLISKIYKEVLQLSSKEKSQLKWAKDPNKHFSKEEVQISNKCMKRHSASLIRGKCKPRPQ